MKRVFEAVVSNLEGGIPHREEVGHFKGGIWILKKSRSLLKAF